MENPITAFDKLPVLYALLAALCYGISIPVAKILLADIPPAFMAAMLYLGAGVGMGIVNLFLSGTADAKEARLTRAELPYVAAMVALDIAAPILLMFGLTTTTAATASLLNNFEIVATSAIALVFFKEAFGKRMWLAITLITFASVILSVENFNELEFSPGALFILLACVCWGVENNCTSRLSSKNPLQIVIVKGIGSGAGVFFIALLTGGGTANIPAIAAALFLGFVAYGMSIYFYIRAQRGLGAARTSALYALAPFIGVGLSFSVFRDIPGGTFYIALTVMLAGAYLAAFERHEHIHAHARIAHDHRHSHDDGHHEHAHHPHAAGEHSHAHVHEPQTHGHAHSPDAHHAHGH